MNNLDKTMNTNEQENYDSTNEAEETVNTEEEVEEQDEEEEDFDTLRERLAASEKENKTLKFQKAHLSKKAKAPKVETQTATKSEGDLSSRDLFALIEAKVPESGIDDVREYASLKNISIKEALASNVVKTILKDNAEQIESANAANVGPSKRGSSKLTDEALIAKAEKGEMPESKDELMRLLRARRGIK
jgi:hypothetical protein